MPKCPLNTDDQNRDLRNHVLAYREALRQRNVFSELAQEANLALKKAGDRCEELKELLSWYVDKHVDKVVVTLDGGNIACLIQFVETYGVSAGVHVSFLPVFGYESGPSMEKGEIVLEPLPERKPHYEYAGKLGPWARSGSGERFLAVGSLEKPTYKRIIRAAKSDNGWRYVAVTMEDGNGEYTTLHGCNTNTYIEKSS